MRGRHHRPPRRVDRRRRNHHRVLGDRVDRGLRCRCRLAARLAAAATTGVLTAAPGICLVTAAGSGFGPLARRPHAVSAAWPTEPPVAVAPVACATGDWQPEPLRQAAAWESPASQSAMQASAQVSWQEQHRRRAVGDRLFGHGLLQAGCDRCHRRRRAPQRIGIRRDGRTTGIRDHHAHRGIRRTDRWRWHTYRRIVVRQIFTFVLASVLSGRGLIVVHRAGTLRGAGAECVFAALPRVTCGSPRPIPRGSGGGANRSPAFGCRLSVTDRLAFGGERVVRLTWLRHGRSSYHGIALRGRSADVHCWLALIGFSTGVLCGVGPQDRQIRQLLPLYNTHDGRGGSR